MIPGCCRSISFGPFGKIFFPICDINDLVKSSEGIIEKYLNLIIFKGSGFKGNFMGIDFKKFEVQLKKKGTANWRKFPRCRVQSSFRDVDFIQVHAWNTPICIRCFLFTRVGEIFNSIKETKKIIIHSFSKILKIILSTKSVFSVEVGDLIFIRELRDNSSIQSISITDLIFYLPVYNFY